MLRRQPWTASGKPRCEVGPATSNATRHSDLKMIFPAPANARPSRAAASPARGLLVFLVSWAVGLGFEVSADQPTPGLTAFYRSATTNPVSPFHAEPRANSAAAFHAVVARDWLPGLVPVFAVEKNGFTELRRLPGKGQENFAEPLFFGLPTEGDTNSTQLAGRWEAAATRDDGSKVRVALELAVEGERVAARFDQNTDYRFAFIESGAAQTNRLTLEVRYIQDTYQLLLSAKSGHWTGRWRRTDDTEGGALEFTRGLAPFAAPPAAVPLALHECRRPGTEQRLYLLAHEAVPPGWERLAQPLCRVWRP